MGLLDNVYNTQIESGRQDTASLLGGVSSLGQLGPAIQKSGPASATQKWLAKVLAGEMSPQEAAAYAKAEQAGMLPSGDSPTISPGNRLAGPAPVQGPVPEGAPPLGAGGPAPSVPGPGAAPGAVEPQPSTGTPPGGGLMGGVEAQPPPSYRDQLEDPNRRIFGDRPPGGLLSSAPEVETQKDFEDVLEGAATYGKIMPRYRSEESVKRIDEAKARARARNDEARDTRKASLAKALMKDRIKMHAADLKYKYDALEQSWYMMDEKLKMIEARIGQDARVAAIRARLDTIQTFLGLRQRYETSLGGMAGMTETPEDLQAQIDGYMEVDGGVQQATKGLSQIQKDLEKLGEIGQIDQTTGELIPGMRRGVEGTVPNTRPYPMKRPPGMGSPRGPGPKPAPTQGPLGQTGTAPVDPLVQELYGQ